MPKLLWFFPSFFLFIFIGCTGDSGSGSGFFVFEEFRAMQLYSESIISCPTGDCPSFVGGLYSLSHDKSKGYTIGACSLSLIVSDRVLTNAHCIPENISRVGESCLGSIRIVFPKTDKEPLETFGCEKILNKASVLKNPDNPDWVILKLDKPSVREPVTFDFGGIGYMEPVTLYKVDFDIETFSSSRGTIVRTSCLANTNNMLSTEFLGPVSPLFNVSDCDKKLVIGNSGSAVLNKDGNFIGLFSFISPDKNRLPLKLKKKKNIVGGGTNGVCIPFENHRIPERCEFDEEEHKSLAIRYAYWLRMKQDDKAHNVAAEIHKRNTVLHSSSLKFSLNSGEKLMELSFDLEEPMALLKSDFINQAFPFLAPSFPECVYNWMGSSFPVVLETRIPDYFDEKRLFGLKNKSDYSIKVEGRIWEQTFLFERQKKPGGDLYKVKMVEMENSPLADLLLLKPHHDFHFFLPICK